jgi:hypothetical protein
MCIEGQTFHTAQDDTQVWKLLAEYKGGLYPIFYAPNGEPTSWYTITAELRVPKPHACFPIDLADYNNHEAIHKLGGGYSCFLRIEDLQEFKQLYKMKNFNPNLPPSCSLTAISFHIPKGARYAKGKIVHGFIGAGTLALRAERLVHKEGRK